MRRLFITTNIEQEDFWKLNQMDRIEFRQRYRELEHEQTKTGFFGALIVISTIAAVVLLLAAIFYPNNVILSNSLFFLSANIFKTAIIVFLFLLVLQLCLSFRHYLLKKQLISEYFTTELKVHSPEEKNKENKVGKKNIYEQKTNKP